MAGAGTKRQTEWHQGWAAVTVRPVHIDIVIFDGVDELDALGPAEVFRNAERAGAGLTCALVTRVPQELVTGSHRMRLAPDGIHRPGADMLLVPGGGWNDHADVGAWGEAQRGLLPAMIADAAAAGCTIASVCTGALLLAAAGVIGNRRATTHHGAYDALRETGAQVVTDRIVDDGDLLTCGGVTSGIDLALWIVERFVGAELAEGISRQMEWPRWQPAP